MCSVVLPDHSRVHTCSLYVIKDKCPMVLMSEVCPFKKGDCRAVSSEPWHLPGGPGSA